MLEPEVSSSVQTWILGYFWRLSRGVNPRLESGHARALSSRAAAAVWRFPSRGSTDLWLSLVAFPRGFPNLDLQNEVEFCGWVSDKAKFFNSIDIFVLPSLEEAFGIVLLESALAKKPIISSTADGPKEVFSNTNAAIMFEKGNAQMLAEKLQELIKNPDFARKLADNAYNLVLEKYTIDAGAKLLNAVLQKIMENKK